MGAVDVGQTRPGDSWEFRNLPVWCSETKSLTPFLFFEGNENLFKNWEQNTDDIVVASFFLLKPYVGVKTGILPFLNFKCVPFWGGKTNPNQQKNTFRHQMRGLM